MHWKVTPTSFCQILIKCVMLVSVYLYYSAPHREPEFSGDYPEGARQSFKCTISQALFSQARNRRCRGHTNKQTQRSAPPCRCGASAQQLRSLSSFSRSCGIGTLVLDLTSGETKPCLPLTLHTTGRSLTVGFI